MLQCVVPRAGLLLVSKDCPPVFLIQSDSVCPTTNSTNAAFLHSHVGYTPSIPGHCTPCITLFQIPSLIILTHKEHSTLIQNQHCHYWYKFTHTKTNSRCNLWRICFIKKIVWGWILDKNKFYLTISFHTSQKTCKIQVQFISASLRIK